MVTIIYLLCLITLVSTQPSILRSSPSRKPPCRPVSQTRSNCLTFSCNCGWCPLPDSEGINPVGHCFLYSEDQEVIEKYCHSADGKVETNLDLITCLVIGKTPPSAFLWANLLFLFSGVGMILIQIVLTGLSRPKNRK